MIDFRYHLVSIVAVFLALGLGIVLGATALQPPVLKGLDRISRQEYQQIIGLRATVSQLQRQASSDDQFAQTVTVQLLPHLLDGQRVVLVNAPGAPSQVTDGVSRALRTAGATITGQVMIQAKFFDFSPPTQQQLGQLAQQFAPPGMTLRSGTAVAQASQVLASAILTKDGPGQPVAGQRDSASAALLNGFGAGGFLTVSGHPNARATLAVVVIPANPPSPNESSAASQALVTLARQLNFTGQGTVVAGSVDGSGPRSAIDVMRAGSQAGHLSSVDDADRVIGQIVVAQALAAQLRGISGSYGALLSASAAGPSPVPTPSSGPAFRLRSAPGRRSAHAAPATTRTGKP